MSEQSTATGRVAVVVNYAGSRAGAWSSTPPGS